MVKTILITGLGGQGVITLEKIIVIAAHMSGYEVIGTENKGSAQRGGGASSIIKLYKDELEFSVSSRVMSGEVHYALSLEMFEVIRYSGLYNADTIIVTNELSVIPLLSRCDKDFLNKAKQIKKDFASYYKNLYIYNFTDRARYVTKSIQNANIALLAFLEIKGIFLLDKNSIEMGIENVLGAEHNDMYNNLVRSMDTVN